MIIRYLIVKFEDKRRYILGNPDIYLCITDYSCCQHLHRKEIVKIVKKPKKKQKEIERNRTKQKEIERDD